MKTNPNRGLFLLSLGLAIVLLIPYEWYFRTVEQWPPGYDLESLDVWADQRAKVASLDSNDVIIMGSSRAHFDLNIHRWDSLTGRRPLQLAYPGSSPYHPIEDIVEQSDFKGLLVIGVAPGLFFTMEGSWGANRGKAFVDQFYKRTYAQVFSQRIYDYIDPHFSYLQDELSIKSLVDRLPFENRESVKDPDIWPPMIQMDRYRNARMIPLMENDTAHQQRQKDIWFNPDPKNRLRDSIDVIMNHYVDLVKKIQARGGRVAFIRAPIKGYYLEVEPKLFPRVEYWDRLIRESGAVGYHYADHPETRVMEPPEWSHLNRKDSDRYTEIIVNLLRKDKLL